MSKPHWNPAWIATQLAGIQRYNGAARRNSSGMAVTAAEHCVHVSYLIVEEGGNAFEGLMHDVPEVIIGDMPAPYKFLMPDFCRVDRYLWESICDDPQFHGLNYELSAACRRADWRSLMIEARELMPSQGKDWHVPDDSVHATYMDPPLYRWSADEAEARWINRFHELTWVPPVDIETF